jgi:hypothetical protein
MRRFLPVVMAAGLAVTGCEAWNHKTPELQGRWTSVTVTPTGTNAAAKSMVVRLDPDGRFFINEMQAGSDIPYVLSGTWTKVTPEWVELHPYSGSETLYLISEKDGVFFRSTAEVAKMKKDSHK